MHTPTRHGPRAAVHTRSSGTLPRRHPWAVPLACLLLAPAAGCRHGAPPPARPAWTAPYAHSEAGSPEEEWVLAVAPAGAAVAYLLRPDLEPGQSPLYVGAKDGSTGKSRFEASFSVYFGAPGYLATVEPYAVALDPHGTPPGYQPQANLMVVDLRTGQPAWRAFVPEARWITASGEHLVVTRRPRASEVWAQFDLYRLADGRRVWTTASTAPALKKPGVAPVLVPSAGRLVVIEGDADVAGLVALDLTSGREVGRLRGWLEGTSGHFLDCGHSRFALLRSTRLLVVDARSMRVAWSRRGRWRDPPSAAPAARNLSYLRPLCHVRGTVLYALEAGAEVLWALDLLTGKPLWHVSLDGESNPSRCSFSDRWWVRTRADGNLADGLQTEFYRLDDGSRRGAVLLPPASASGYYPVVAAAGDWLYYVSSDAICGLRISEVIEP